LLLCSSRAQAPSAPAATAPAAAPAPPASPELAALIAEIDANWVIRDQPGKMDLDLALLQKAEKIAPGDYEVLLADGAPLLLASPNDRPSRRGEARLGKLTWDWFGPRHQANPARVEGWFYGSAGVGMYSIGIRHHQGAPRRDGVEVPRPAQEVPGRRPGLLRPRWRRVLGRYWYELPWPSTTARRASSRSGKALRSSPTNLRAKVYLAELYIKEDHPVGRGSCSTRGAGREGRRVRPTGEERRAAGLARAGISHQIK